MVTAYLVIYYGEDIVIPHKWFFGINLLTFYQVHFFVSMKLVCEEGLDKVLND